MIDPFGKFAVNLRCTFPPLSFFCLEINNKLSPSYVYPRHQTKSTFYTLDKVILFPSELARSSLSPRYWQGQSSPHSGSGHITLSSPTFSFYKPELPAWLWAQHPLNTNQLCNAWSWRPKRGKRHLSFREKMYTKTMQEKAISNFNWIHTCNR